MSIPTLLSVKALQRLIADGQPVLVEFFSPSCVHCAALEPTIERLAREWGDRVTVAQVDLSEYPKAGEAWTVMGTPTVLVFADGEEKARLTGVQPPFQYTRELQKLTSS